MPVHTPNQFGITVVPRILLQTGSSWGPNNKVVELVLDLGRNYIASPKVRWAMIRLTGSHSGGSNAIAKGKVKAQGFTPAALWPGVGTWWDLYGAVSDGAGGHKDVAAELKIPPPGPDTGWYGDYSDPRNYYDLTFAFDIAKIMATSHGPTNFALTKIRLLATYTSNFHSNIAGTALLSYDSRGPVVNWDSVTL